MIAQTWPLLKNAKAKMAGATVLTSASGNTIAASLPPSSSVRRLSVGATAPMIARPVSVEPVNVTLATSACLHNCAPASFPPEVGRAACRERVCQYVEILGAAVNFKNKHKHIKTN